MSAEGKAIMDALVRAAQAETGELLLELSTRIRKKLEILARKLDGVDSLVTEIRAMVGGMECHGLALKAKGRPGAGHSTASAERRPT